MITVSQRSDRCRKQTYISLITSVRANETRGKMGLLFVAASTPNCTHYFTFFTSCFVYRQKLGYFIYLTSNRLEIKLLILYHVQLK